VGLLPDQQFDFELGDTVFKFLVSSDGSGRKTLKAEGEGAV
jgi:hypothetical protein